MFKCTPTIKPTKGTQECGDRTFFSPLQGTSQRKERSLVVQDETNIQFFNRTGRKYVHYINEYLTSCMILICSSSYMNKTLP